MWTVVGGRDVTDYIPPDNEENGSGQSSAISANASLSDPNSTWDFALDDINQTLNIQNFQPVIVWDENAPAIGGVPTVPTMNILQNPILSGNGTSLYVWGLAGFLPTSIWNFSSIDFPVVTVNNNSASFLLESQLLPPNSVQPGLAYMFSVYQAGSGTIVNLEVLLQIQTFDIFGSSLGTFTTTYIPVSGQQSRATLAVVMPAGAYRVNVQFGVQTTVGGTNSGSVTFGTAQFEPMWFVNKGVSYPTPDCNVNQVNSILMPDGTTSRACRRFAGYVEDRTNSYVGKQRHTVVKCASSSKLLETIGLVSASYTSTQDTTILANVLSGLPVNTNSLIGQLATGQQNIFAPTSTLIPGVVIDSISWNNATLRQVINDLGAQSGSLYYVDAYYYLWYVPPSFAGATIAISDTPDGLTSFPYANFSIEYDSTNPVNTALVVGSKQKAAVLTDVFNGDGVTTVFGLSFPPENVHAITVGAATIRTGVDGVDNKKFGSTLTYKALINKQAQTLKFATAPVSGTGNVSISYTYEDQVISQVIAADAVAEQGNVPFWGLVNDSAITSTAAAKNRGLAELASYAYERVILNFDLLGIYVPVGSLVLFTNQSEGLTGAPFVVQTVQSDLQGGGVDNWQYTAGVYNPTIIDHLRNATKAIQKSPTTANVVVIASIDVALFDSLHINDSLIANVSAYASAVGVDNPLRQFRLGESGGTTAHDISGNGFNGTLHGGITLNQPGLLTGDSNAAMLFNGSTGWIGFSLSGLPTGASPWTLEAWCQVSAIPTNGYHAIVGFGAQSNQKEGVLFLLSNGTTAQFVLSTYGGDISGPSTVAANTPYHVCGTYDGTSTRLYVNGSLVAGPTNFTLNIALAFAGIGADGTGPGDWFGGTIDEVAIYGSALSSTRVLAHYNAGI